MKEEKAKKTQRNMGPGKELETTHQEHGHYVMNWASAKCIYA
jgi:hypothetical protein